MRYLIKFMKTYWIHLVISFISFFVIAIYIVKTEKLISNKDELIQNQIYVIEEKEKEAKYLKSNLDQLSREREKQSLINKANENVEIVQDYVSHFLEYGSGNNTNLYLYPDQSAPILDIINGEVLIYNVVMDRNKEFKKWALVEYVDSSHYPLMYNHIGYVLESDLKYEIKEKRLT